MEIWNQENCIVGEGPLWDPAEKVFWQVDIRGKCLYKLDEKKQEKYFLPQKVGCMALNKAGRVLVALEDGVYWQDTMALAHQPTAIKGERFNDGKVGPDGAFYLGTASSESRGAFYRLKNGVLTELFDGCTCSNGLDWSCDGKLMYYIDTLLQRIELFDFDRETGELSNRRTFMEIPAGWGKPDGMTIDEHDDLWVAFWDGYCVMHIDHMTGKVLQKLEMPCPKVSCCAFGGTDLRTLFVTTAAMEDHGQYPQAGKTFAIVLPIKGRKMYYYGGAQDE